MIRRVLVEMLVWFLRMVIFNRGDKLANPGGVVLAMSVRFLCVNGPTEMIQMSPTVPVMEEIHAMTIMVDIATRENAPSTPYV